MLVTLIIAFNLGLFSTLHCIGMCGGILTALMLASPESEQKSKLRVFSRSLAYNLGRISSYSLAGLLTGFLGLTIADIFQSANARLILQSIAALVLIVIAINMLGIMSLNKYVESIGMKLWQHIQPIGKHLLPIKSLWRAFLFGLLWGWLPCGMVYSALLLSISTGTPFDGMLTMLFFGLGTLPSMLTAGYFSDYLKRLKSNRPLRITVAVFLICIAISLPLSTVYFAGHHDHHVSTDDDMHEHHEHHH
jgi:sulfite exporter TauE/SafE